LKFEFARYLAVYRGIPRHTAIPLGGGKKPAVGKKNTSRVYHYKKNLKINCNLILNGDDTRASMHDERLC
jgi:hypothetical protein